MREEAEHTEAVVERHDDGALLREVCTIVPRFIAEAGPTVIRHAPQWSVPTLLMFAGQDKLVNPAGSRTFADSAPPQLVTTRCFEHAYHEIFNEPDKDEVFATLKKWLDAHFGGAR